MARQLPSQETLLQLLHYDPATGKLYWKSRALSRFPDERAWKSWNTNYAGQEAFTSNSSGYKVGTIDRIRYRAHRIIWMMVYGEAPIQIDHIKGIRSDNRLEKLRPANNGVNRKNQCRSVSNSSGVTGVYWNKAAGKWQAYIVDEGEYSYLGLFTELVDAASARKAAEVAKGFHPNHGREAIV